MIRPTVMTSEGYISYLRARAWVFFLLYAGLLVYVSHQPGDPTKPLPFPHYDKLEHILGYFVFGFFLRRALHYTVSQHWERYTIIGTLLFAISDEIHQSYIPFRNADPWDIVADMLGALLGLLFFRWVARYMPTAKPAVSADTA